MFKLSRFIVALLCTVVLNAQTNKVTKDKKDKPMLIGKVNQKGLKKEPFKAWYTKNYNDYLVNDKVVHKIKDSLKDYTIKVFFGTWCGDSKKGVPQFLSVLDKADFPKKQIELVALDNKEGAYKQSPKAYEKGLNIHRVPTFIFYKNGKEVNRIVESPRATFERDILKLLTTTKYKPNYYAVTVLEDALQEKGLDSLKLIENALKHQLSEMSTGSKALNSYGYIKMNANKLDEAEFILKLNTKLYPFSANTFDSLAELYFEKKQYQNALKTYYKALALLPESKNAKEMIAKIEEKIKAEK